MEPMDKNELRLMHFTHLGVIFSNISIVGLIFLLSGIFGAFLVGLFYLLLIFLVLATFFLILIFEGFRRLFSLGGEILVPLTNIAVSVSAVVGPLTILTSVLAIVFLSFNKKDLHKSRIVFSSVLLALSVIGTVMFFALKGGSL